MAARIEIARLRTLAFQSGSPGGSAIPLNTPSIRSSLLETWS